MMHHMAHRTSREWWFAFAMSSFLDRYLGGEELKEPILEEGNVSTMICHKGPHGLMSSIIFKKKTLKIIVKNIL